MKRLIAALIYLLLLAFVSSLNAGVTVNVIGGEVAAGGCTSDYCEDFEGAGTPANWTAGGADFDNSTAGLDMEASQCLEIPAAGAPYYDGSAANEIWVSFKFRYNEAIESQEKIYRIRDSSNATIAQLNLDADEEFHCQAYGGTQTAAITTLAPGTSQYWKVRAQIGTGADAEAQCWYWNGSAWAGGALSNDGTSTVQPSRAQVQNPSDTEIFYYDEFQYHSSDITSPTW